MEEEGESRGPAERFPAVCDAFQKQSVTDGEGKKMSAQEKRNLLEKVVASPLEDLVCRELLQAAKQDDSHGRLQRALRASNPTIKDLSVAAMAVAKWIHESACSDEFCKHCSQGTDLEYRTLLKHRMHPKRLAKIFERISQQVIDQERAEKEKEAAGGCGKKSARKNFPAKMFTIEGFPPNFRYKENMVSSCLTCLGVISTTTHCILYSQDG